MIYGFSYRAYAVEQLATGVPCSVNLKRKFVFLEDGVRFEEGLLYLFLKLDIGSFIIKPSYSVYFTIVKIQEASLFFDLECSDDGGDGDVVVDYPFA